MGDLIYGIESQEFIFLSHWKGPIPHLLPEKSNIFSQYNIQTISRGWKVLLPSLQIPGSPSWRQSLIPVACVSFQSVHLFIPCYPRPYGRNQPGWEDLEAISGGELRRPRIDRIELSHRATRRQKSSSALTLLPLGDSCSPLSRHCPGHPGLSFPPKREPPASNSSCCYIPQKPALCPATLRMMIFTKRGYMSTGMTLRLFLLPCGCQANWISENWDCLKLFHS